MSTRHRHGRTPPVRFGVLVVILLLVVGAAAWVFAASSREDPAPRAGAGTTSPDPAAPRSTSGPSGPSGSTERSPSPDPSPSPEPRRPLTIHGTGDVSLDPNYIPAFRSNGYGWAWSGLDGLFERDDLTVVNHECPSTDIVAPIPKQFSFRCDPEALVAARRAGVEVMNLANNHGFDQGPEALLDSVRNVERAGIVAVGAGRTPRRRTRRATSR